MVSIQLQHEIEQFLYGEVRLLSEGRYHEWTDLFADDARYWMPIRGTTLRLENSVGEETDLAVFDDDKAFLLARVQRLESDLAHAERPQSRTRYFVTNVEIESSRDDELHVLCNLLVFQSRLERTENFFVGRREDKLRKVASAWKIAHRKVVLDHALIPRSISIFF